MAKQQENIRVLLFNNQKQKDIKPRLPLVFIDSVYFCDNSLDNIVQNLEESDF